jgi:Protein of unknown function (DUF2877)
MRLQPMPSAAPTCRSSPGLPCAAGYPPRVVLAVAALGYQVPQADFTGRVHSVFAQACNLASGDTLFTLVPPHAGNGPSTLRLAVGAPHDLRDLFDVGEPFSCRQRRLRTGHTELRLQHAAVWRPTVATAQLAPAQIDSRLRRAAALLARRHGARMSVIEREAATLVAELSGACRALDIDLAMRSADALIGWGEGLTPAGDDFLVGLLAGLGAFVQLDERRPGFLAGLGAAIARGTARTTPIAAHYLRLAAGGHFTEPLVDARDGLLCEPRPAWVDAALGRALAVGATSGADTVSGLLAGLCAWLPPTRAETS